MRRTVLLILVLGLTLDLASWVAWARPELGIPFTVAVLAVVAVAALRDLRLGVAAVFLELLWGSHGYLLHIPTGGVQLSLRMGIFLVVFAATVWHLRTRVARAELWDTMRAHPLRLPALAFLTTLILALGLGFFRHSFDRVYFDANAWAFLVLGPTFLLATSRMTWIGRADHADTRIPATDHWSCASILTIGACYLIVRTYALLFLFSHDLGGVWFPAYQWVRDTRLGEITVFPGGFPRVFMASMVLLLAAAPIAAQRMWRHGTGRSSHVIPSRIVVPFVVFGGSIAVLILSLSRSYWLALTGLAGLWIAAAIVRAVRGWSVQPARDHHSPIRTNERMMVHPAVLVTSSVAIGLLVAVAVVRLPYPRSLATAGVGSTLLQRLSADAAVSNRWQQIGPLWEAIRTHMVFGNGFGAAVTYESRDPRTLAAFPDGRYTTTAFEWGYLDDLLERGLVGLLSELWLLAALIRYAIRRGGEAAAIGLGLLAVAIVHATSPYLNHPIGLGLLLATFGSMHAGQGHS